LISSPPAASSGLAAIMSSTVAGESAGSIGKLHSIGEGGSRDDGGSTAGGTTPTTAPRRVGRVFDPSTDIDVGSSHVCSVAAKC
jgi:hypothetical protein